jgi:molybdate transport system regulatory protein
MSDMSKLNPRVKLWIQSGKEPIAGEGKIELLLAIEKDKSLNRAARKFGMSYRHAWGVIKELERRLGFKVVAATRGGMRGGGTCLTKRGQALVKEYKQMNEALEEIVKEKTFWEDISTKISARNRLSGVVESVQLGEVGANVKIAVKPAVVTAFITREAAEALELKKGDRVEAVIKATEVMVAKP